MERLTSLEREEIELLSMQLTGRSSAWQTMVKRGIIEKVLDEEGKQVFYKGSPLSRTIYKTEREILDMLKDLKNKKDAFQRAQEEAKEKAAKEQEILKQVQGATGSVSGG
jgi:hypothetical protein